MGFADSQLMGVRHLGSAQDGLLPKNLGLKCVVKVTGKDIHRRDRSLKSILKQGVLLKTVSHKEPTGNIRSNLKVAFKFESHFQT